MWFGYGNDISSLNKQWLEPIDEDSDWSDAKTNNFVLHETERIESISLRGDLDSKLLSSRRSWDVVISADELSDDSKYNFIINYWNSGDPNYIDITTAEGGTPNSSTWIKVNVPGGVIPIEFLSGNHKFREFSTILKESDGSL